MGVICPKDHVNCPDDVCRGSDRCVVMDAPLLDRCEFCGGYYSDAIDCACGRCGQADDDEEYDDEPDPGDDHHDLAPR